MALHRATRRPSLVERWIKPAAAVAALAVLTAVGSASVPSPAAAVTSLGSTTLISAQTFFVYVKAGELPRYTFTQTAVGPETVDITVTDPTGTVQQHCAVPGSSANGVQCSSAGAVSPTSAGIWTIKYDPHAAGPNVRYTWDIAATAGGVDVPGRVWVEHYVMSQIGSGVNDFSFWIGTREGYLYRADFGSFFGIVSGIESSGFGLTASPTSCVPIYHSVEGAGAGTNDCGVDYKLFLEAPSNDLPASAPIAGGTDWIRPAVTPASVTNLTLQQNTPLTRAGTINFDLAGVNGGFTIALDTNNNGSYTDPVDRVIPSGGTPGPISVPFDGLDGQGNPLSVCEPMHAKVIVDKVGEAHLVLRDVESFSGGLKITGATPGVLGANPKVYWDDRNLVPLAGQSVSPSADGRNGVDTSVTGNGTHSWTDWGNNRSIDNWTYYQAQAGAEIAIPDQCSPALVLDKKAHLDDTNGNGLADLGETISYSFDVTNTGNATVSGISITDPKVTGITSPTTTLGPGASATFTAAPYAVTQADLIAGRIDNTAVADGTSPISPVTSNEDSTSTPTAPPPDFGDAPASYGTLLAGNGPRHELLGYDRASHTASLMLGAHVDFETDGAPGASADGDDTNGTDDEDGVATPITQTAGQATTVQVSATNSTATPATLAGWLDLNGNGVFDPAERATVTVPASSGTASYGLTFPASQTNGDTYARFRLFRGTVADPQPKGASDGGEVEDYPVSGQAPLVSCTSDPALFNTGYDGTTKATPGTLDRNWQVALGDASGPASAGAYIPAFVVTPHPAWYGGTFNNATWISYYADRLQPANLVDLYFKYTFRIAPEIELSSFALPMEYFADNSVQDVWINGVSQDPFEAGLPMSASPYSYAGFQPGNKAATSLSHGFQYGLNTMIVRVASGAPAVGFMAQINAKALCTDRGDAPDSYGTSGVTGASHGVVGYDAAAHTATLMLGAHLDTEFDGSPGASASGDDNNGIDDEDGVTGPVAMTLDQPGSVTVRATNQTGSAATLAGWVDLDGNGTFDTAERVVVPVPAGTSDGTFTLSFPRLTSAAKTYARFRLFPGTVADPSPTGQAAGGEVEDYPVTTNTTALDITKTSTFDSSTRPGDTVTYTVKATNTGTGAFTAGNPAKVVDNLRDVLDDATYDNDASANVGSDPSYTTPNIVWSGALGVGQTVTITYTVTLEGGGDGHLRNVAFQQKTGDPGPDPVDCPSTTTPCAVRNDELPKLSLDKTASRSSLPAVGGQLTYTVTVTNTGEGAYTPSDPATFDDDLSKVLDDATFASVSSTTGTASLTGQTLHWSGVLAPGASATITYTVTYTGAGDHVLLNRACVPADQAQDPGESCRTTLTPGSGLRQTKTVDPGSGTPVAAGTILTYMLTFENVGGVDATVNTSDDLADILDDADLVGSPVAGSRLNVVQNGDSLAITGTVPAGATRTVTYQVQVGAFEEQGDHVLENSLACEPGDGPSCEPATTTNPVRHLVVTKTSDASAESRPGDQVTYTVTMTNDGAGDYTALDPATLVDDLTGVLDDATFGSAGADRGADPAYDAPRLTWSGALGAGDTVTLTYTVTLKGGGDGHVDNVAWAPPEPGPTPDCASTDLPCADESFDLPRLTIKKVSNRTSLPAVGDPITYTVTVHNAGPGDYTAANPATFSDDLSDVLDDADLDLATLSASTGTTLFLSPNLFWSGVLASGESATITYTLTYTGAGDLVVDNKACVPVDEALNAAGACRTVHTPGSGLRHEKSVSPASGTSVVEGQVLTYTLTFENVGPADATVETTDDLSGVLDDADLVGAPVADTGLTAVRNGDAIDVTGTVPSGQTLTVTYQAKVRPFADQGDHTLVNALACEPGDPQPCAPETTRNPVRHLVLVKSANPATGAGPGDTIHYTLHLTNDGTGDYTQAFPAALADDLSAVLDDATFDGQATASSGPAPSYAKPLLTWSGPLAAGDDVTVGYDVVVKGGGDGLVANTAWAPADPTDPGPQPDCTDPQTTVPCDTSLVELPKLTVAKTADRQALPAVGQTITYTVTVHNPGPGDYTAEHPATLSDDLSGVLDDAPAGPDVVNASTGTASVADGKLTWTGVLGAGDSATITYAFTYQGTGDHVLANTACVPAAEAQVPGERCDTVSVPGSGLTQHKSVDPASGTPVEVGQVLTYTLTFHNAGQADATVDTSDDLSDVLDDATLVDDPVAGSGLTATVGGDGLDIAGTVPAGQTRTVTYQVKVKAFGGQGDHVLTNALACEPGDPQPCAPSTTSNPVRHLVLTKERTSSGTPDTGDVVTYALTVTNDGQGDWTGSDPVHVVDDLTGVLDDATWDGTQQASAGTISFARPDLSWTGALAAGDTVTITYSVTVTNQGDHELENTAHVPGCALAGCNPDPVVTALPHVVPSKTSDPASGQDVQPGDVVTYTLSWTNDGEAAGVVDATDDLSGVLDDASFTEGPTSSDPGVVATRNGDELRVAGPIAADGTVTVTYQVRVKPAGEHGDDELENTLVPDTPQVTCSQDGACTPVDPPATSHLVGDLDDWKTVDPATGSTVRAGDHLTYTLHFANTGTAPVEVDRVDDLTDVLDDAALVDGPASSSPGLTATGPSGGRLSVTGTLGVGDEATVTYTVAVKADGKRGNDRIGNFLLDPGQPAPDACTGADPDRMDCTVDHVSNVVVTKASSPADGSKVGIGDDITYTLTFRNVSKDADAAPTEVDQVDHLDEVLDDAVWKSGPTVSNGALQATRDGSRLSVSGELSPGQVTTVTYAVTVTGKGDGRIRNVVVPSGEPPVCAADSPTCTSQVSPVVADQGDGGGTGVLPSTGSGITPRLLGLGLGSLLLGLVLVLGARRRRA